jgi:serine/threonine protein kinase
MEGEEAYYQTGQRIPDTPYICERVIGQGGYGVVYVVHHHHLGTRFALKTLHRFLANRDDLATRMHNEAQFLARIRHPNIVPVRDGGVTGDGRPYLVMDLLNGESLYESLLELRQGLGPKLTLKLVELLDALDIVHRQGAVHRDIKPGNIFIESVVDEAGRVTTRAVLLDFGVTHFEAKRITGRSFLGTQKYAAPEQIRGEKPSGKSDVYSLGLVLYECLCGSHPYGEIEAAARGRHGEAEAAVAGAHLSKEPIPHLSTKVRGIDEIAQVVMTMIEKDPAKRPDARTAATALRELRIKHEADNDRTGAADANKTDPTPAEMRQIMLAVPPSERDKPLEPASPAVVVKAAGPATAPAVPDAFRVLAADDTVRDPMPAFRDSSPRGLSTVHDAAPMGGARTLLPKRPDPERDRHTAQHSPMVDRLAPTPTLDPDRYDRGRLGGKSTRDALEPETEPIGSARRRPFPGEESIDDDDRYMPAPSEAFEVEQSPRVPLRAASGPMIAHGRRPGQSAPPSSAGAVAVSTGTRPRTNAPAPAIILVVMVAGVGMTLTAVLFLGSLLLSVAQGVVLPAPAAPRVSAAPGVSTTAGAATDAAAPSASRSPPAPDRR